MPITFTAQAQSATIKTPRYGYNSFISMKIDKTLCSDGSYTFFDNGTVYDRRKCSAQWLLTATELNNMNTMFKDPLKSRGEDVTLNLGTNSGFYPFGPDYGDSGEFVVRVLNYNQGGQLFQPFRYYILALDLQYISGPSPSYSFSDNCDDGNLQIGTITGIRYPQAGYDPETPYKVFNAVTFTGDVYSRDAGQISDIFETSFKISGNQGKMAALIDYIVSTARSSNTTIITQANNYLFGRDKSASGSMIVQPTVYEYDILHDRFDNFSFDYSCRFVS